MKLLPHLLALTSCMLLAAEGGAIIVSSNDATPVRDSNGGFISGGAIRVGFLDLSGSGAFIVQNATTLEQIEPFWTPLAEGTQDGGTVTQSGNTGDTLIVNDRFGIGNFIGQIDESTSLPQGTQLFLWLFNDPDPSEATEWAIVSSTTNPWAVPNFLASTLLSTNAIDQIYRGNLTDGELRLDPKGSPSGFDAWLVAEFDAAQLAGTEADGLADPDQDSWSNLAEYVFGMDPLQADSPGERFKLMIAASGEHSLNFTPVEERDDVVISGFTSLDLQTWTPTAVNETSPGTFAVALPQEITAFARLGYTR